MIRGLVAIDENRGMADDHGIPWDIPGDRKYFVAKLQTGRVLMGYGTYIEMKQPFGDADNYIATHRDGDLPDGYTKITDVRKFLAETSEDIWNIGGPGLLAATLDLLDELYVTQIDGDFHCTKFLPEFHEKFSLTRQSALQQENGTTYRYQVWSRIT